MSTSIIPFSQLEEDEKRQPSYGSTLVAWRDSLDDDEESPSFSWASARSRMEKERPSDDNPRCTVIFAMTLVVLAYAVLFYGAIRGEGALLFGSEGREDGQVASVIVTVLQQVHQQP
jgi:hypothetical protein